MVWHAHRLIIENWPKFMFLSQRCTWSLETCPTLHATSEFIIPACATSMMFTAKKRYMLFTVILGHFHLFSPHCFCTYHLNFTSPYPFFVQITLLLDSGHTPVNQALRPKWRHSIKPQKYERLIILWTAWTINLTFFWNSWFSKGFHIKL